LSASTAERRAPIIDNAALVRRFSLIEIFNKRERDVFARACVTKQMGNAGGAGKAIGLVAGGRG